MLFTCLRVPGLLLMVLVLLSISNTKRGSKPFCQGQQGKKEREGRSEAKNNCKRQLQHKGNQDAATQTYDTLLHTLHVGSGSSTEPENPPCARNNCRRRDCQSRAQPQLCANQIRILEGNLIIKHLNAQTDANGLRENSRVQVSIIQVLLALPIPLLFITHWCLKA